MERSQRKAYLMEEPDNLSIIVILGLCFLFIDWLSFGEGGVGCCLKLDVQVQGVEDFGYRWTRGVGVLKIGQFSWASYVYHP